MKIIKKKQGYTVRLTDTEYAGMMWLTDQGWGSFESLTSSDWDCLDRSQRQGLKRLAHVSSWSVEDRRD